MPTDKIIGLETPPFEVEVEKGAIRKLIEAIGDTNPLFLDEEIANKSRFEGLIAPPTFATTFRGERPDVKLDRTKPPLFARQEYDYFRPLRVGDKLTCQTRVVDTYEKESRRGPLRYVIYEMIGADENGEKVFVGRQFVAFFK